MLRFEPIRPAALSDINAPIQALEQKWDKTKLVKQDMMQELLTGKTRPSTGERQFNGQPEGDRAIDPPAHRRLPAIR